MATPNRLEAIAQEKDEPLEKMIPRLLEELGTMYLVAVELKVYPNTILGWLKRNHYRYDVPSKKWVKKSGEDSQAASCNAA